jgi:hypothetical protein
LDLEIFGPGSGLIDERLTTKGAQDGSSSIKDEECLWMLGPKTLSGQSGLTLYEYLAEYFVPDHMKYDAV